MSHQAKGGRMPAKLTHFLCLPLVNHDSRPQLGGALQDFKQKATATIPVKAVRPLDTLHLTLGVMSLSSQQLKRATTLLGSCDVTRLLTRSLDLDRSNSEAADPSTTSESVKDKQNIPLTVTLEGLLSMHEPASTSILYVSPQDTTERLVPLCLAILDLFRSEDLLKPDGRPLKLHATIVNTIYAKNDIWPKARASETPSNAPRAQDGASSAATSSQTARRSKVSNRFDARQLLDDFASFQWADRIVLDRIAICEMGAKQHFDKDDRLTSESYTEVAHIALPTHVDVSGKAVS